MIIGCHCLFLVHFTETNSSEAKPRTETKSTRSVLQSCRSSHHCYPVPGLSDPAHWSPKHGTRHCRQATSCYHCSPKGCISLDHASLVNWMSGINQKSKHYLVWLRQYQQKQLSPLIQLYSLLANRS